MEILLSIVVVVLLIMQILNEKRFDKINKNTHNVYEILEDVISSVEYEHKNIEHLFDGGTVIARATKELMDEKIKRQKNPKASKRDSRKKSRR